MENNLLSMTIALITLFMSFACTPDKANSLTQMGEELVEKPSVDSEWAMNALWDDGQAEVAIYEAERVIYGKPRQYDLVHILVKESFNSEFNAKTDDYTRDDLFEVMKINQFADIPTDNYPYHFLTSIFLRRNMPGQVHKYTGSSQEWCGNTFKQFDFKKNNYVYTYHSYWDGEGDGDMMLPGQLWFEDQLTYTLRTLAFEDGLSLTMPVMETQVTSKAKKPLMYDEAKVKVAKAGGGQVGKALRPQPEGGLWLVTVQLDTEKTNHYWIEATYPNALVKMETWDGRNMSLKEYKRGKYWERPSK